MCACVRVCVGDLEGLGFRAKETSRADSLEEPGQAVSQVELAFVFSFSLSSTRARLEERPEESFFCACVKFWIDQRRGTLAL